MNKIRKTFCNFVFFIFNSSKKLCFIYIFIINASSYHLLNSLIIFTISIAAVTEYCKRPFFNFFIVFQKINYEYLQVHHKNVSKKKIRKFKNKFNCQNKKKIISQYLITEIMNST